VVSPRNRWPRRITQRVSAPTSIRRRVRCAGLGCIAWLGLPMRKTDLRASQTGLGADGAQRSLAMGGGGPRADADSMRRSTQWQKKARCSGRSSRI
jgi:hypothetical protein